MIHNLLRKNIFFLTLLFILPLQEGASQGRKNELCCMFYNVENLFHPSDDSLAIDEDFTPEGERRWTYHRYHRKIAEICKIILAVNGWEPPAIICLNEIENKEVLEDITGHPLMVNFDYGILHRDGPDRRGIEVAILYRRDIVNCIDTTWISIKNSHGKSINTREILTAKFTIDNDTLLCAVNHWTSKYGGEMETEEKRIIQARNLGEFIDSARSSQPGLYIIAGGDLNDTSGSLPLKILQHDYNLYHIANNGHATYKYKGIWDSVDHLFAGGKASLKNCRAIVPHLPFLLEPDEKYTGMMPRRTYRGFAYNGGISDHLPLLLYLKL